MSRVHPHRRSTRAPARVLVVDAGPGETALAELNALAGLGLTPTVNVRRMDDPALRARVEAEWDTVDFDGFSEEELAAQLEDGGRGHDVLKCRAGIPLTEAVLERATASTLRRRLVLAGRAASGSDTFDHAAARRLGVAIRTTAGANAGAVAELAVALMLDALRGISWRANALRDGSWSEAVTALPTGSLADARVGLVGSGAIARRVAELVRAFGADVRVFGSPRFTAERAAGWPGRRVESLDELLAVCDVVSVHVPATPETEGLIGERELRLMRHGSVLVNTARASVVSEEALDRALRDPFSGPARAAVDTFEVEGPGFSSVLAGNPHCLLSPHAAGMTRSAMQEASRRLLAEFERFLSGKFTGSTACGGPGRPPRG
ncbi:D-isomer specific 2-hydroxyacid dehydrogenase family protein [Streptomyces sp. NPDC006326]|uniref:D-isomer specific 2-hydroxyacid dehydrogenase family protein n=1 Tax=Streptomyces sp. NPDC006326 TaxID=3156752 RepID=UPI0033A1439A